MTTRGLRERAGQLCRVEAIALSELDRKQGFNESLAWGVAGFWYVMTIKNGILFACLLDFDRQFFGSAHFVAPHSTREIRFR